MLCFADFWLEGDGDQALFDVGHGLVDGEYPVFYYNHDGPSIRKLADNFTEFIEEVVAGG
ncbi:MAG: SMI1/KNR4 family protein [Janthinobacterium lividum]